MRTNNLLGSTQFLRLIADKKCQSQAFTFQGDVHISGQQLNLEPRNSGENVQLLDFENITFLGTVTIDNFERQSFRARNAHFLGGLLMSRFHGDTMHLSGCTFKSIQVFQSSFRAVTLTDLILTSGSVDLSGLTADGYLNLGSIALRQGEEGEPQPAVLELISRNDPSNVAQIARCITDDSVFALQCRLIGVPVFMSSEAVRKLFAQSVDKTFV